MPGEVFVSYSRKDMDYVRQLVSHLRDNGLDVWWDQEIPTGERFRTVIRDRIDECAAFVVVMTPTADDSKWVELEIDRARASERQILPLLLQGRPFLELAGLQYTEVVNHAVPGDEFIQRLRVAVGGGHRTRALVRGEELHPLRGSTVAFAPTGTRLATTADDRVIVWDAATGQVVRELCDFPNLRVAGSWYGVPRRMPRRSPPSPGHRRGTGWPRAAGVSSWSGTPGQVTRTSSPRPDPTSPAS
jgi:hypothetical protein